MNQHLQKVVEILRLKQGLDVSSFDRAFLANSLGRRLAAGGGSSLPAYLARLAEDRAEAEAFCASLNINHSEFFRNPLTFALLEQRVLPGLIEARKAGPSSELRVWSAGCAAGQEIYSLILLLEDLARARGQPVPVRIFATDIDTDSLAAARQGVFAEEVVQNVRHRQLRDYFSMADGNYAIAPRLRARVDFSTYDLREENSTCPPASLYGDFDLILCCNVLFYYRANIQQRLLEKFCRALAPGGYFVTGEAECDLAVKHGGCHAVAPAATVFQKYRIGGSETNNLP